MTVVAGTDPRDLLAYLAHSQAATLLRVELERRWPERADRLSAMVRYALLPAGKLVRPIMLVESARAVGGRLEEVLPAAVGVECLHVATLVHDDIIDGDEVRRGRAALATAYGMPDALVTGDRLIFSSFEAVLECRAAGVPGDLVLAAVRVMTQAGADLCRGQALEAQLAGDPGIGVEPYLEMIRLKTGALFRGVCEIGAILGGADPAHTRRLASYGEQLGIAFQIRDDLLAFGAPARTSGKPPASDLVNARPTLPVLLAYQACGPAGRRHLADLISADLISADLISADRTGADRTGVDRAGVDRISQGSADTRLEQLHALLAETGVLRASYRHAAAYANRAGSQLTALDRSPSVDLLAMIAHWAAARGW